MRKAGTLAAVASSVLVIASTGQAAVTVTEFYRFGENDGAGIVDGSAIKVETVSSVGSGKMWTQPWPNSSMVYSQDVPDASRLPAGAESTLSVRLNGNNNDAFLSSTGVANPGITDNFGMQVWIKPESLTGTQVVAYNGNNGQGGYGLILVDSQVRIHFGGVGSKTIGVPGLQANVWTHLAIVRDSGETRLFVNGVEVPQATAMTIAPLAPLYSVKVGNYGFVSPGTHYTGYIDNLSFFTFNEGEFEPSDLQVVVPEPAMLGLVSLAGIGLMRRRH